MIPKYITKTEKEEEFVFNPLEAACCHKSMVMSSVSFSLFHSEVTDAEQDCKTKLLTTTSCIYTGRIRR